MREILFRGKRADNGEWVEGYVAEHTLIPEDLNAYVGLVIEGKPKKAYDNNLCYVVDPETVGQYVGLKDKNGKKIFEGDIVRHRDRIFGEVVGVIEYDDGCFCVHTLRSPNSPAIDIVMNESEVEVIGNIHDDKEILNDSTV